MTPWLLKHSPGFSSILIYTGPAGVAKAHVHRLCSRSLLLGVFLEKLQPRGCEGEGKNRKGKSAWSYGYFSYPVTGVSGKDFQQRSCLCFWFYSQSWLLLLLLSSCLCMCAYARVSVAQIADLSEVLFVLQVCPHYKHFPDQSCWKGLPLQTKYTHTHTHARKHTHPSQRSPARCHGNLVNSTPTVTQLLHQASQSGVGGERRERASGAQLQFQLVSFHVCKFGFSPWVWRRPRSCSELHTCVAGFIEKIHFHYSVSPQQLFLPFRQLHNSPIFQDIL